MAVFCKVTNDSERKTTTLEMEKSYEFSDKLKLKYRCVHTLEKNIFYLDLKEISKDGISFRNGILLILINGEQHYTLRPKVIRKNVAKEGRPESFEEYVTYNLSHEILEKICKASSLLMRIEDPHSYRENRTMEGFSNYSRCFYTDVFRDASYITRKEAIERMRKVPVKAVIVSSVMILLIVIDAIYLIIFPDDKSEMIFAPFLLVIGIIGLASFAYLYMKDRVKIRAGLSELSMYENFDL